MEHTKNDQMFYKKIIKTGKTNSFLFPKFFYQNHYSFSRKFRIETEYDIGIYQDNWNTGYQVSFGIFDPIIVKFQYRYNIKELGFELRFLVTGDGISPSIFNYPYRVRKSRYIEFSIRYIYNDCLDIRIRGNGYIKKYYGIVLSKPLKKYGFIKDIQFDASPYGTSNEMIFLIEK